MSIYEEGMGIYAAWNKWLKNQIENLWNTRKVVFLFLFHFFFSFFKIFETLYFC